jgi:exodeoxyribonuclease VII large subunit
MQNDLLASAAPQPGRDIWSVTRLNREARAVLEGSFSRLWVQGEVSNLRRQSSGHLYFSLKDANAQVSCAMFKGRNRFLRFTPADGMLVLARSQVSLYENRGQFQLIVEELEPAGEGALQRAFEELKQRLHKEGLFDEALKKPLPPYPQSIGVVTSPTGAALRDILQVLKRRWPIAEVIVYPAPVQGAAAAPALAAQLRLAGERNECDVLILARGGGSLEDLWAFNDETLARTIRASTIPVVSGVGHEIDFTIADFAADRRAPTPSAAAELVSPDRSELSQRVAALELKVGQRVRQHIRQQQQHLAHLGKRLPDPSRFLAALQQRVDDLATMLAQSVRGLVETKRTALLTLTANLNRHSPMHILKLHAERCISLNGRLRQAIRLALKDCRDRLARTEHALRTVSPLATLDRGYAIVTGPEGSPVVDAAVLKAGQTITARFARGRADATVIKIEKDRDR